MCPIRRYQALVVLGAATLFGHASIAQGLDLEQRILCQQRLEQVTWNHTLWPNSDPKPELADVLPAAALGERVRNALLESRALDVLWRRPLTHATLQAELDRIVRDTRDPSTLRELIGALDNDALLVAECLARPLLADRLLRRWHAESAPGEPFDTWWDHVRSGLGDPDPSNVDGSDEPYVLAPIAGACSPDSWRVPRSTDFPDPHWLHTAVWTGSTMIVWGGDNPPIGSRYEPATDTWRSVTQRNAPASRFRHTAVWTGTRMIVWGGYHGTELGDGGIYDPLTDTWQAMSTAGAPVRRGDHTAVWTGERMLVWGGRTPDPTGAHQYACLRSGGSYDPVTDTWTALPTANAPSGRFRHGAVWSGSRLIVWGGDTAADPALEIVTATGGSFDPASGTWSPLATSGAPSARGSHGMVWTGSRVLVFGGDDLAGPLGDGRRYDPALDRWESMSSLNAPSARTHHAALWGGSRMLVWGGRDAAQQRVDTGALYDPVLDAWQPTPASAAPSPRQDATAVWTGTEFIVWGGIGTPYSLDDGARLDPVSLTWVPTATETAPIDRFDAAVAWTGSRLLIWGGENITGLQGTGARYDPATDSWIPMSTVSAPSPRVAPLSAWTGTRLIVWGGGADGLVRTGAMYDPQLDKWLPMPEINAPAPRANATAVWTGSRMIVWGGDSGIVNTVVFDDGASFEPATLRWRSITSAGGPGPRMAHTATWTGSRMIVWGGASIARDGEPMNTLATGASYDPRTDSWTPVAPSASMIDRRSHTAVWNGSRLLIWGGAHAAQLGETSYAWNAGAYDPATDSWTPLSTIGEPELRYDHAAFWMDGRMVVWGGYSGLDELATGGSYDPAADRWAPLPVPDVVIGRQRPALSWTGTELFVTTGYTGHHAAGAYCPCDAFHAFYADHDGDGIGIASEAVNACSTTPPAGYTTVTGDCDDANGSVWATPGEASTLTIAADRITLAWLGPEIPGGTSDVFDVLRALDPVSFRTGICVASGTPLNSVADLDVPPRSYFYLVRAVNGCGRGPLGFDSRGAETPGRECP